MNNETMKRRTFAIISHPDAGKTTITEKLLLYGGAIQMAGSVKARKSARHATSDWMALEKQRGISVTTSVMQFPYDNCMMNLLDTPGHGDFSEDTYRTLTAVDSALMVIDAAKGVEQRTIKLLDVCRLRTTPIISFINKMDRDTREPIEILDEIETVLKIQCAPITWPIGMGKHFKGIYNLIEDCIYLYESGKNDHIRAATKIVGLNNPEFDGLLGNNEAAQFRDEIELVRGASHQFEQQAFLAGELTPVYFGSAINNFGVRDLLDAFAKYAPPPQSRATAQRQIEVDEPKFSGFVFKIQANMDPKHHDRMAFLRVCSGRYEKGMKIHQVRIKRDVTVANAMSFMAGERMHTEEAYPGDILGLHNHGTMQIGDTFSEGEDLQFTGIPNFAAELFRSVRVTEPLKAKALQKGLLQLSEEGATQLFRPLMSNDLIVGAVGVLQFDVVAHRLKYEYKVDCVYDQVGVVAARWVSCEDAKIFEKFKNKARDNLALDAADQLIYLAPTRVNLNLAMERYPEVTFSATREH